MKRLIGMRSWSYEDRLKALGLKRLELRRLHIDLIVYQCIREVSWWYLLVIFDHPRSGVVYNIEGVCLSVCVCLYVCQAITVESLDTGSSFSLVRYISREYGSSSYMKVIGSRSRSRSKKGRKSLFLQCKTSIGNNSVSKTHAPVNLCAACCFRRIEWCDHHFRHHA